MCAAQFELQGDLDIAERARRRHLGEAGDLAELLLERRATEDAMVCGSAPGSCAVT